MNLAPIVLFVYNRPWHTEQTLQALSANELADQSTLFIYADGPKANVSANDIDRITKTREVIRKKQWCKEVIITESAHNNGLANSIIDGVTGVINKYGKTIVLEDDIISSPHFLQYMNDALESFKDHNTIGSINAFVDPDIKPHKLPAYFFLNAADCWGWATWKDRWDDFIYDASIIKKHLIENNKFKKFDYGNTIPLLDDQINGKINTWDIQWHGTQIVNDRLGLYPNRSFVLNIGLDGTGTHGDIDNSYKNLKITDLNAYNIPVSSIDFKLLLRSQKIDEKRFKKLLFKKLKPPPLSRLKSIISRKSISFLKKNIKKD